MKLDSPSATPSIRPSAAGGAPIAARNSGRTEVPASWPKSDRKRLTARPTTFRLSQ